MSMVCTDNNVATGVACALEGIMCEMLDGGTKSPLNLVGLAAAGADGTNKGRLTVDGDK